jgi:hypothetical protein
MKALILKDLFMLKKTLKIVLVLIVFYIILFLLTGAVEALPMVLTILSVALPIGTFTYDEANKWDRYALSGPLHRQDIVRAKYLLVLLLASTALLLSLLGLSALRIFISVRPWTEILLILGLEVFLGLMAQAIILPFIYKLGVERGRMLLIAVLLIPIILLVLYSRFASPDLKQYVESYLRYIPALLCCLVVGGFYLSYRISLRIYMRKDF